LVTHLSVLADEGLFEVWDDTRIGAGQEWEREIGEAMSSAAVAVLMVSPDFLASKFVKTKEIPRLLQRREGEGMRVIPVIVRPCPWQRIPWLSAMQAPEGWATPSGGRGIRLTPTWRPSPWRAHVEAEMTGASEALVTSRPAVQVTGALEAAITSRPDTFTLIEPIRMDFVRIPAGSFLMGSDKSRDRDAYDDELPQHTVEVVGDFYIGKYPVTNAQYAPFARATRRAAPSSGKGNHPAANVTWRDAVAFAGWLSLQTGKPFRLPAEPEWEKVRADGWTHLSVGDEWDPKRANTSEDGPDTATPVGRYSPFGQPVRLCGHGGQHVGGRAACTVVPVPTG
jgi:hypothetical protein